MISLIPGLSSTASALDCERIRLEVISNNIANAQTTRGPDGKPFQRQEVVFENVLQQTAGAGPEAVRVARVQSDPSPPRLVYDPTHPDADARGMVAYPNINIHREMVDMIAASRSFEANLAVLRTARSLAMQTLAIGKRS